MTIRKRALVLVLVIGAMIRAGVAASDDAPNVWGGQHVSMQVTRTGAELQFDCATGTISEPLPLDKPGRFRVKGTFTREHGGPVRRNEPPAARDATYSGIIENDTIRLRIEVAGQDQAQEYVLNKGQQGRVVKCR